MSFSILIAMIFELVELLTRVLSAHALFRIVHVDLPTAGLAEKHEITLPSVGCGCMVLSAPGCFPFPFSLSLVDFDPIP